MPIDPRIALGVQQLQLQDPLAQYAKVAQIQNAQQANALNQLKMQEAQREISTRNALNAAYQQAYDPNTQQVNENALLGSLATQGFGAQIPSVQKGLLEAQTARTAFQKGKMDVIKSKMEAIKPLYQQALNSANPGAAALEIHSAVHQDPDLGPWLQSMGATAARGEQDLMAAMTQGPDAVRQKLMGSIVAVDKLLPQLVTTDTGGGTQFGTRNALTGAYTPGATVAQTPLPASVLADKQSIARAGAINMPAEKYPPVAVVNPVNGNVEYVSRKEAIETRAAPATEQVVLPAKEKRKREAAWPTANANIKAIEVNAAEDAKRLRDLANHPGLSSITGLVAGRTPNFTGDARQAQALYDQIVAKGGFKMLQDMKEASKNGGALGNVSDREGQRLEAAYGAINQTQDTEDVKQALLDLADKAEAAAVRARDAFDETYLYRTEKPSAAAPAAQGGATTVTLPDGQVMSFPDAASAAAFKKAAGL